MVTKDNAMLWFVGLVLVVIAIFWFLFSHLNLDPVNYESDSFQEQLDNVETKIREYREERINTDENFVALLEKMQSVITSQDEKIATHETCDTRVVITLEKIVTNLEKMQEVIMSQDERITALENESKEEGGT